MAEMENEDSSAPAFPVASAELNPGMTLRQWYAGMAMQGLMANGESISKATVNKAFLMADYMVEEGG